ncbi:MAG TPA: acetylglutamate kinase [Candidatus Wujingus californicus]|uniref:acetylglutamate kinase n=1 Tax=Candidatus Wujingus californicus TaxID=3367618 RepID=UPI001DE68BB7|nr:acetylglutamate kinase [Planctomycetota bacterium]MDO8130401.1 acetylglutamate kinase [Candidatus Brocadiales bacterium]
MENAIQKANILIEAIPYIRSFKNKIVVIKFGGGAMANDDVLTNVLQDIVFMKTVGMMPILVHGGGPHINQEMGKRGMTPEFIEGHRITDSKTLEIARDILINRISASIVKKILELGSDAACIWEDGYCPLKAEKHYIETKTDDGKAKKLDIGFVGKVTSIDKEKFLNLCNACTIPVVPPIAKGNNGDVYNVNADNVAAFIATALCAEKLVFLSNTNGIMTEPNDETSIASTLHEDEVHTLIQKKIIGGGMLPKALACIQALKGGVKKAHIINGLIPHALLLEIFTEKGVGTQIII